MYIGLLNDSNVVNTILPSANGSPALTPDILQRMQAYRTVQQAKVWRYIHHTTHTSFTSVSRPSMIGLATLVSSLPSNPSPPPTLSKSSNVNKSSPRKPIQLHRHPAKRLLPHKPFKMSSATARPPPKSLRPDQQMTGKEFYLVSQPFTL